MDELIDHHKLARCITSDIADVQKAKLSSGSSYDENIAFRTSRLIERVYDWYVCKYPRSFKFTRTDSEVHRCSYVTATTPSGLRAELHYVPSDCEFMLYVYPPTGNEGKPTTCRYVNTLTALKKFTQAIAEQQTAPARVTLADVEDAFVSYADVKSDLAESKARCEELTKELNAATENHRKLESQHADELNRQCETLSSALTQYATAVIDKKVKYGSYSGTAGPAFKQGITFPYNVDGERDEASCGVVFVAKTGTIAITVRSVRAKVEDPPIITGRTFSVHEDTGVRDALRYLRANLSALSKQFSGSGKVKRKRVGKRAKK